MHHTIWTVDILPQGDDYWIVIKGDAPTPKELAERIRIGVERALYRNGHPIRCQHEKRQDEVQVPELSGSAGQDGTKPVKRRKKGQNSPTE